MWITTCNILYTVYTIRVTDKVIDMKTTAEKLMEALSKIVDETSYTTAGGNSTGSSYTFSDGSKLLIETDF